MKRLLIMVAAIGALAAGPVLADPPHGKGKGKHNHYQGVGKKGHPHGMPPGLAKKGHPHGMPPGLAKKMWSRGQYVPSQYYTGRDYWVRDHSRYDLNPAPPGYRWVLVEDNGYLVNERNGLVASVAQNLLANLGR